MKKILTHLKNHKFKYILGLVFIIFVGGVSFKEIWDKYTRKRKNQTKIEYIVIHYTANLRPGATAEMNAIYLQKSKYAGTHYCIDDEEIVQCVPEDEVAYAVGDKKWFGFIPKPWLKNKVYNENSISYEMCLGGGRSDSLIIDMTARCVAWQMLNKGFIKVEAVQVWSPIEKRNVQMFRKVPDLGRIVRHHDVSGKHCPRFFYMDEKWDQRKEDIGFWKFKLLVDKYVHEKIKMENISKGKATI